MKQSIENASSPTGIILLVIWITSEALVDLRKGTQKSQNYTCLGHPNLYWTIIELIWIKLITIFRMLKRNSSFVKGRSDTTLPCRVPLETLSFLEEAYLKGYSRDDNYIIYLKLSIIPMI